VVEEFLLGFVIIVLDGLCELGLLSRRFFERWRFRSIVNYAVILVLLLYLIYTGWLLKGCLWFCISIECVRLSSTEEVRKKMGKQW